MSVKIARNAETLEITAIIDENGRRIPIAEFIGALEKKRGKRMDERDLQIMDGYLRELAPLPDSAFGEFFQ